MEAIENLTSNISAGLNNTMNKIKNVMSDNTTISTPNKEIKETTNEIDDIPQYEEKLTHVKPTPIQTIPKEVEYEENNVIPKLSEPEVNNNSYSIRNVGSLTILSYSLYDIVRLMGIYVLATFIIVNIFGINFFGYMNDFVYFVIKVFYRILEYFGYATAEVAKTSINVGSGVSKGVIDVTSNTALSGINMLEKGISTGGMIINKIDDNTKISMNELNNAVDKKYKKKKLPDSFEQDRTRITSNKYNVKSGYCYIGSDRGYRRCIDVGEADNCMSGEIFPTEEICVNPSLRE